MYSILRALAWMLLASQVPHSPITNQAFSECQCDECPAWCQGSGYVGGKQNIAPGLKNCVLIGRHRTLCKAVNPYGVGPTMSKAIECLRTQEEGAVSGLWKRQGVGGGPLGIRGISFGEERERWQGETRPSKLNLHVTDGKDGQSSLLGQPGTWFILQPQLLACGSCRDRVPFTLS